MKTWITADYHLGETRMDLMGRPFYSKEEMIEEIVSNHNMRITVDDTVIIVGDVCYQKSPESLAIVSSLNGKKILVRGNHDRVLTDEQLKPYFHTIIAEGDGIEMDIHGIPCYITHYPTEGRIDRFNLVGHIHSAWKYQLNSFNVGIDVHHFRPVDLDSIPFHLKAITDYYDNDVWVAYNGINNRFVGIRGKKNSYFRP